MADVTDIEADELVSFIAQYAAQARIDVDDLALQIGLPDADRRLVKDAAEPALAFLERKLQLPCRP